MTLSAADRSLHTPSSPIFFIQILMELPYFQEPQPRKINALEGHSLPRPERRADYRHDRSGGRREPTKSLFCNNRIILFISRVRLLLPSVATAAVPSSSFLCYDMRSCPIQHYDGCKKWALSWEIRSCVFFCWIATMIATR